MDSFFGIGLPELIFILLLAGMVLGPHRIRHVARWLGQTTAQLQKVSRSFTEQLNKELDTIDESGEIKGTLQEVKDLRRQVAELRREITTGMVGTVNEAKQSLQEGQEMLNQSILPPSMSSNKEAETVPSPPANGQTSHTVPLPNLVDVPDDPE